MRPWTKLWLGLLTVLFVASGLTAQDAAGLAGGIPGGAAAAAPAGPNLFTMLLPPADMRERCRQKFCRSGIGKMMKNMMGPVSLATGGLIGGGEGCCPAVRKEDLAKPAESSEGAAARIKADLEAAAARREAVRFLGTVDCRYWPEAEEGLIAALRGDKVECVRFEAAIALQRGCCCTKKVAEALSITISASDKDGFPAERSPRVIDAAAMALSMCVIEEKATPKETPKEEEQKKIARTTPKDYYQKIDGTSESVVRANARKALERRGPMTSSQVLSAPHRASSLGLLGMMSQAMTTQEANTATREPQSYGVVHSEPATTPASAHARRGPSGGILNRLFNSSGTPDSLTYEAPTSSGASEIRPVNWVTPAGGAVRTSQTVEPACFSTANSPNGMPTAAPTRPAPFPTVATPQPGQGVLGFVILEDGAKR